ncbi:magnesium transporter [Acholeplasma vituli]|uniref:Magnesium transporter MgtE n=1 Tax=Paracholeplasma vituli TaxID=69473 RepID=A0ABT2PWF4_9MOLU|nr:magnesium transporter [Paracholeplasma vituli]MCU0105295.1 magnesium transporter [Paracholeplasma vituli]
MIDYRNLTYEEQKNYLESLHAYDLKELYESLTEDEQVELFERLDDTQKADLLSYLDVDDAAEIVETLDAQDTADIFSEMDPDDAMDILNELEEETSTELIEQFSEELKEDILSLKSYTDDETGSIMNTDFITLTADLDVKDAMKKLISEAPNVETISKLFVIDKHNTFLGVVPLKKLIKAKSPCAIETLYEPSLFALDTDDKEQTATLMQEEAINILPVLDDQHMLKGIVTVDDAIDTYEDEMIEDFQKMTTLSEDVSDSTFTSALKRLPWLVVLLLLALPIANLALQFEGVLKDYTIIIILQPLILSMIGNAGTQTLTFSLIMIADEEPDKVIKRNIFYEVSSAALSGLLLSLISFVVTLLFIVFNPSLSENPYLFGSIVGISVLLSLIIGTFFSAIIPVVIHKVGLDPASASGPLLTTVIDITTILTYYGIATWMIGVIL